jgi:hypothetical protein
MTPALLLPRRRVLAAGFALAAGLPATSRACEFFCTSLRVVLPWTRATEAGDPWAILCMTFDDIRTDDRLVGVRTPVAAGAELHGAGPRRAVDLALPAGRTVVLDEDGVHLRLTGLAHPLGLGREYPLTLVFERAGELMADLDVMYERKG